MLNWIHTCNVFSNSFQANIFIFCICNKGPNAQTGKGPGKKILKDKGSKGVYIKNGFLAVTFLLLIRFSKSFRFIVRNKEYNIKNMVRGGTFWLLIAVLRVWKWFFLSHLKKLKFKSYIALLSEWLALELLAYQNSWIWNEYFLIYEFLELLFQETNDIVG